MRITIYRRYNEYISLDFGLRKHDKIYDFLYNENIKWYTLSYTEKEMEEYERFFKRHNKRGR